MDRPMAFEQIAGNHGPVTKRGCASLSLGSHVMLLIAVWEGILSAKKLLRRLLADLAHVGLLAHSSDQRAATPGLYSLAYLVCSYRNSPRTLVIHTRE